jgi:hypothetical protein
MTITTKAAPKSRKRAAAAPRKYTHEDRSRENMTNSLLGMLPDGNVIAKTFARMEIAEDLIRAAKLRWPSSAAEIDRVFGIACPPGPMRGLADCVYEHHVRELIDRARMSRDDVAALGWRYADRATYATKAEILALLSAASLQAPLRHEHATLALGLAAEILPAKQTAIIGAAPWTDYTSRLLEELRRDHRTTDRTFKGAT